MNKDSYKFIPVFEPSVTLKDKLSVLSSLNKKHISGTSPVISKFEDALKDEFQSKRAQSTVSNGSVALDLAFQLAKDLDIDDEGHSSFIYNNFLFVCGYKKWSKTCFL